MGQPILHHAEAEEKEVPIPKSAEQEAMEALDERFQAADFSEKVRTLKAVCITPAVDDDMLMEWFLDLGDAAETEQEGVVFEECVDLLRKSLPEVYSERAGLLLNKLVKFAVRSRRGDAVGRQFRELARFAQDVIDHFYQRADQLAYHGYLDALVEGFRIGWPAVREAKDIFESGISAYADLGVNYEMFAFMERAPQCDTGNPELANRVRFFSEGEDIPLSQCVGEILGSQDDAWERKDFEITRKTFRNDREKSLRFCGKLDTLLNTFLGWLHREKGMTYTKANLVRMELHTFLVERLDGVHRISEFLNDKPFKNDSPIQNLVPDRGNLEAYLVDTFSIFNPRFDRGIALFEGVPHWLEFLTQRGILDEGSHRSNFDSLSVLFPEMERLFEEGRWGNDFDLTALEKSWTGPGFVHG